MILVTAATGNVGHEVLVQLLAAGRPVRALSRDPARAATVPDVTGRPGRTFAEWAAAHRSAFA